MKEEQDRKEKVVTEQSAAESRQEERNSDVVKKVHLKENSFYLVSLIEHKSNVDYNVVMQVFRYITF